MTQQYSAEELAEWRIAEIQAALRSRRQTMGAKKIRIEINYSDLAGQCSITEFGNIVIIPE